MYEFAKIVMWFLIGFAVIFALLFVGQVIETESPGSFVAYDIANYCFVGALALFIACAIYDKGWNAAKIDREPNENIRRDSTT